MLGNLHVFLVCRFNDVYEELSTEDLSVVVGMHQLNSSNEAPAKRHYIAEAVMHPTFDDITYANDIMLLRVKTAFEFNSKVKPICTDASAFPVNTRCVATGWGVTDQHGK